VIATGGFWIIIPSRGLDRGKSRLAAVLGPDERRAFNRTGLRRIATAARSVAGAKQTVVISPSADVLGLARRLGVVALPERCGGLNGASRQGLEFARQRGAHAVMVVHADLPRIEKADLFAAMRSLARHSGAVIAPDRNRTGTNALALRPALAFRFRFGPGSFSRHLAEARRLKLRVRVLERAGLESDVDTPEDYAAYVREAVLRG
jgi:2-phospho-L-lactate/phosphoenolpyruvate guanylyltransferase